MNNILDYTLEQLSNWMESNGQSKFRSKQIFSWIYKEVWEFDQMKNLPKALRETLKENFYIGIPELEYKYVSKIDETKKLLLKFNDGNIIETVIMKYRHGNSICVSTQVGCRMGCKFCASTLGGRVRDLSAGEILSQVMVAQHLINERISNIVLMGSGEPLDNYDNVLKFINIVNADYGLNIGQRHITLSTCGIVPKIYELSDMNLSITLAISLHATTDEKRKVIMPIANKYSIKQILDACEYYIEKTNRRVTFEYSLVRNVNDSMEDAKSLGRLLKGILCHVNLIPINEVNENSFSRSSEKTIDEFENTLKSLGIEVTLRREMGTDINAACGQLRRSYTENCVQDNA